MNRMKQFFAILTMVMIVTVVMVSVTPVSATTTYTVEVRISGAYLREDTENWLQGGADLYGNYRAGSGSWTSRDFGISLHEYNWDAFSTSQSSFKTYTGLSAGTKVYVELWDEDVYPDYDDALWKGYITVNGATNGMTDDHSDSATWAPVKTWTIPGSTSTITKTFATEGNAWTRIAIELEITAVTSGGGGGGGGGHFL